jgi:alpha-2-macroglobulin
MFVGGGDRAQARQLLSEVVNHAKESPSEVHFEETEPGTYATTWSSDARTTAIALQTLTDVAPDHPFVPKIAAYLTKARRPDGRFRNTQESAFALMALTEVVRTREKEAPDFTARVVLGGATLAETSFRGRSLRIVKEELPMSRLPGATGELPLDFRREGTAGILYYGALLRYAPSVLPKDPLERGLVVQRWFEPYGGGGAVRAVRAGELVRIRVRVASHMERNFVAVDVPLPSGLEAVDTTLASSAGMKRERGEEGRRLRYGYDSDEDLDPSGAMQGDEAGEGWARGFWSPFNHVEQRDDRVVLFADRLPPGVHVASFVARATTPGEFLLKPARAEEMYSPEVFGRSDGGTFQVVEAPPVAGR